MQSKNKSKQEVNINQLQRLLIVYEYQKNLNPTQAKKRDLIDEFVINRGIKLIITDKNGKTSDISVQKKRSAIRAFFDLPNIGTEELDQLLEQVVDAKTIQANFKNDETIVKATNDVILKLGVKKEENRQKQAAKYKQQKQMGQSQIDFEKSELNSQYEGDSDEDIDEDIDDLKKELGGNGISQELVEELTDAQQQAISVGVPKELIEQIVKSPEQQINTKGTDQFMDAVENLQDIVEEVKSQTNKQWRKVAPLIIEYARQKRKSEYKLNQLTEKLNKNRLKTEVSGLKEAGELYKQHKQTMAPKKQDVQQVQKKIEMAESQAQNAGVSQKMIETIIENPSVNIDTSVTGQVKLQQQVKEIKKANPTSFYEWARQVYQYRIQNARKSQQTKLKEITKEIYAKHKPSAHGLDLKLVAKKVLEQDKVLKTGLFRDVNELLKQEKGIYNEKVLQAIRDQIKNLMTVKNPNIAAKWQTLMKSVVGHKKPQPEEVIGEEQKFNGIIPTNGIEGQLPPTQIVGIPIIESKSAEPLPMDGIMKLLKHLEKHGKSKEVKETAKASIKVILDGRKGAAKAEALIFAEKYPERQNNNNAPESMAQITNLRIPNMYPERQLSLSDLANLKAVIKYIDYLVDKGKLTSEQKLLLQDSLANPDTFIDNYNYVQSVYHKESVTKQAKQFKDKQEQIAYTEAVQELLAEMNIPRGNYNVDLEGMYRDEALKQDAEIRSKTSFAKSANLSPRKMGHGRERKAKGKKVEFNKIMRANGSVIGAEDNPDVLAWADPAIAFFVNDTLITLEKYFNYATDAGDYISKIAGDIGDVMLESYKKQTYVYSTVVQKKEPTNFTIQAGSAYKIRCC